MKGIIGLGAGCALTAAIFTLAAPAGRAQTAALVTFTFKLTINNTPAPADSFTVSWGETGLSLCNAPCTGGGHTYSRTMTFPKGVTETFVFNRASGSVSPEHPAQTFAAQTLTASSDRTVSASFTYGAAAVPVPATGGLPFAMVVSGIAIAGSGAALVLLRSLRFPAGRDTSGAGTRRRQRRRRRPPTPGPR